VVQEVVTMYLRAELLILQERVRTWLMFCLTMGQNLGGHAAQNWRLLWFLSVLLHDRIRNLKDEVLATHTAT